MSCPTVGAGMGAALTQMTVSCWAVFPTTTLRCDIKLPLFPSALTVFFFSGGGYPTEAHAPGQLILSGSTPGFGSIFNNVIMQATVPVLYEYDPATYIHYSTPMLHYIISFNSLTGVVQAYANDVPLVQTFGTITPGGTFDNSTVGLWSFDSLNDSVADTWVHNVAYDLSITANRRQFINPDLSAVLLPSDGTVTMDTGTVTPKMYFRVQGVESPNEFKVNHGSGSAWGVISPVGDIVTSDNPEYPLLPWDLKQNAVLLHECEIVMSPAPFTIPPPATGLTDYSTWMLRSADVPIFTTGSYGHADGSNFIIDGANYYTVTTTGYQTYTIGSFPDGQTATNALTTSYWAGELAYAHNADSGRIGVDTVSFPDTVAERTLTNQSSLPSTWSPSQPPSVTPINWHNATDGGVRTAFYFDQDSGTYTLTGEAVIGNATDTFSIATPTLSALKQNLGGYTGGMISSLNDVSEILNGYLTISGDEAVRPGIIQGTTVGGLVWGAWIQDYRFTIFDDPVVDAAWAAFTGNNSFSWGDITVIPNKFAFTISDFDMTGGTDGVWLITLWANGIYYEKYHLISDGSPESDAMLNGAISLFNQPPCTFINSKEIVWFSNNGVSASNGVILLGKCGGFGTGCPWYALDFISDESNTNALGISSDGTTIVGYSGDVDGNDHAVAWINFGSYTDLSHGENSYAYGASADGSTIVGEFYGDIEFGACYWLDGVFGSPLDTVGSFATHAKKCSADGTIIVGDGYITNPIALWWNRDDGSVHTLPTPVGGTRAVALDVSGDGTIIVGNGDDALGNSVGIVWTNEVPVVLSFGDEIYTQIAAISEDGLMVVGTVVISASTHGFKWTLAGGFVALDGLPVGDYSGATAVNGDGSIIVGFAVDARPTTRGVWWDITGIHVMQLLGDNDPYPTGVAGLGNARVISGYGANDGGQDFAGYSVCSPSPPSDSEFVMDDLSVIPLPTQSTDNFLTMRYSDDAGASWSDPRRQTMGSIGQYSTEISFRNIGMARSKVIEFSWSAPTPTALTGVWIVATSSGS